MTTHFLSRHLLWKDYRQARPALLACGAILAVMMIGMCTLQILDRPGARMDTFQSMYVLPLLAPMLCAMACSGMLIGQERQTRTWSWSSSLPISWRDALLSKIMIWFTASLLLTGLLGLLYTLLYGLCHWLGFVPSDYLESDASRVIGAMLYISFEAFLLFSLAVLIMKESLSAMILAGAILAAVHLVSIAGIEQWTPNYYLIASCGNAVVALLLVLAFRWRWGVGQLQSVSISMRRYVGSRSITTPSWSTLGITSQPSEWKMLLHHSLRSSFVLRSIVVAAVLGIACFWTVMAYEPMIFKAEFCFTLLLPTALILGASTFSGDQSNKRFQFYADRGVRWYKLLLIQITPPLLITCGLLALFLWPGSISTVGKLIFIVVALTAFLAGVIGSLVSASPLMGALLGSGAVVIAAIIYFIAYEQWYSWMPEENAMPLAVFGMCVGAAITTVTAVKRWLVTGRALGMKFYGLALSLVIVIPFLLSGTFAFLMIPNRPWQGYDLRTTYRAQSPMPQINPVLGVPQYHLLYSVEQKFEDIRDRSRMLFEDYRNTQFLPSQLVAGKDADYWKSELAAITKNLDSGNRILPDIRSIHNLELAIESTAVIGAWATLIRDADVAAQAWQVNASLIDVAQAESGYLRLFVQPIVKSWTLRCILKDEEWQFLSKHSELSKLVPRHFTRENLADQVKQIYSNWYYQMPWPVAVLPPLRWYHQRRIALALSEELAKLNVSVPKSVDPSHDGYGLGEMRTLLVLQSYVDEQIRRHSSQDLQLSPEAKQNLSPEAK